MATLNITLKVNSADASQYTESNSPQKCLLNASKLLAALASGSVVGNAYVQRSSSDPVAASGTFTIASAVATDAITIGTVTLTASSTPGADEWEIDGSGNAADAASLAAAINAHATLSKVVVASSSGAVVTVTALQRGLVGNQIPISSADATITASGAFLTGGTGGSDGSVTAYGR